jgi:hypothetical protein
MATIKVPIMHLKLEVAGETKEFKSPLAETILAQVRKVVVGQEQVQYYDVEANKFKSFTYCCGDKYSFDYTVIYAKLANEKAFTSYNDYLNLDEQSQGKFVTDYGKPKPYVYQILSVDKQRANIEDKKDGLRNMYRHGGKLDD